MEGMPYAAQIVLVLVVLVFELGDVESISRTGLRKVFCP